MALGRPIEIELAVVSSANPKSVTDVASAFVRAINHQNIEELAGLMTEDHVFIDSLGTCVEGREKMTAGWAGYFRMIPDYTIVIEEAFAVGAVVLMCGTAQGTYAPDSALSAENRWSTPAALRAVVRGELVAEWRVYADNEPIRQIAARNRREA